MLRRHIVLLIAIRPSDEDVKSGGPLGAFREEQAISRHRVSPSPFLSSSSSPTTQLYYTNSYTYSHTNLNFVQYTIQIPTRNVVCPSGAWLENRPNLTPSIRLAWNPKRVIVQWVGIGTHSSSIVIGYLAYTDVLQRKYASVIYFLSYKENTTIFLEYSVLRTAWLLVDPNSKVAVSLCRWQVQRY